jgi:hypothetical protein
LEVIEMLRRMVMTAGVLMAVAAPMGASQLPPRFELSLSNDLLAGDQDDRYTAALSARVPIARSHYRVDFAERMFTDRAAGRRFDETRLALVREGLGRGGWTVDLSAGVLRVGRGVLGESVQNAIHRAVGSDEVDLDYVGEDWHLELGARAIGPQRALGRVLVRPELELASAPSFATHAAARVVATIEPVRGVEVQVGAGVRSAWAEMAMLDAHLDSAAPELQLGVTLFERLSLRWSDNAFGTGDDHIHVQWRLSAERPGRRAR